MAKRKKANRKTMTHKAPHRKLKIEQHEPKQESINQSHPEVWVWLLVYIIAINIFSTIS
jgi:hypothetical protein